MSHIVIGLHFEESKIDRFLTYNSNTCMDTLHFFLKVTTQIIVSFCITNTKYDKKLQDNSLPPRVIFIPPCHKLLASLAVLLSKAGDVPFAFHQLT